MDAEEDALAGLYVPTHTGDNAEAVRERSANLFADPKMRELKHYTKSHNHEGRLRVNAELEQRAKETLARDMQQAEVAEVSAAADDNQASSCSLRSQGCDVLNRRMKRLASEKIQLPHIGSNGELPEAFCKHHDTKVDVQMPLEQREAMLKRMDRFETRLRWRGAMDRSVKRLLIDMDLARDDRLKEYSHKARCDQLDKIYDWYKIHGMKEVRKERAAPPYVRFNQSDPVMAGSLRVAPKTREGVGGAADQLGKSARLEHSISHSASLPTLTTSAAPALDSSPSNSPKVVAGGTQPQAASGPFGRFA